MSQVGFTPIQIYRSSTAAAVPTAGNLVAGELAINTTDEKLYFENTGGTVTLLASSAAAGGTFTTVTATTVVNGLGAVGTPSYTFTGDLNTGMWSPAADTIAFSEGGVEAMRISSSGFVGIGTTSPAAKLDVTATTNFNGLNVLTPFGGNAFSSGVFTSGNNSGSNGGGFGVKVFDKNDNGGGSTSGYGVYVSSPYDGVNASGNTYSLNKYGVFVDDLYGYNGVNAANTWGVYAKGGLNNYFAGNVGIGTTAPGTKLDIRGAAVGGNFSAISVDNTSAGSGSPANTVSVNFSNAGSVKASITSAVYGDGYMAFATNTNTEKMRLDASGNLGIGTSAPFAKLAVNVASSGTFQNAFGATNAVDSDFFVRIKTNVSDIYNSAGSLTFSTITTERMRIDTSGNLGLGTTAPVSRLGVISAVGTDAARFSDNSNYTLAVRSGGTATALLTGTVGSAVAFGTNETEKMRINNSGNVMIGTTTDNGCAFSVEKAMGAAARFENTQNTSGDVGLLLQLGANANNTSSYFLIAQEKGVQNRLFIYGNGNVVNLNGSYGTISDIKVKENVFDATPKLDKLLQIRVINYNLIGETQKLIGVVAQELEQIFPGMIDVSPDRDAKGNDLGTTTKSVKYSVFVPMLIKAMQEQQALITSLTARVAQLEGK